MSIKFHEKFISWYIFYLLNFKNIFFRKYFVSFIEQEHREEIWKGRR